MRSLSVLVVVVGLVGCSAEPEPECGPETCSGCCVAGQCLPGTAQGLCGSGGAECVNCGSSGATCEAQACVSPPSDAGTDAGVDAGEPEVFVTLRYQYAEQVATGCPGIKYATPECAKTLAMPKSEFDLLRLEYAECDVTQPASDGWEIDCTGQCTMQPRQCPDQATGGVYKYDEPTCPTPAHATAGACGWNP